MHYILVLLITKVPFVTYDFSSCQPKQCYKIIVYKNMNKKHLSFLLDSMN